jgi:DNA transformation protein and related proteins
MPPTPSVIDRKPTPRSLKSTAGFERFVLDQLADLGDVTSRKMFGGIGLYCGGVFFGIIARDELYLKVDETTRREYEGAGMRPFKPYRDRPVTMQYYAVPLGVLESAMELTRWARRSVTVAARTERRSPRQKRRSTKDQ